MCSAASLHHSCHLSPDIFLPAHFTMSDVLPFFSPTNRGFHPDMSLTVLVGAAQMAEGDYPQWEGKIGRLSFEEVIGSYSHLVDLGKRLSYNMLPSRTPEEIRRELLRLRGRWNRVIELKMIEAALRDLPVCFESREIRFRPKEYEFYVQVIDVRIIAFCYNPGKF